MKKKPRVLILEDSIDDTELVLHELRRAGYEPAWERVETAGAMRKAIGEKEWDVIVSDYTMPQFNLLEAIRILKESELDLPFIIVSGTIGESTAVEAMRSGAHDYLMKGKLQRLVPAIEREFIEAAARRNHRKAEKRIKHLNLVLRAIRSVNQLITTEMDRDRLINRTCELLVENRGYYNAWIALMDESGGLVATAEAGLGRDFLPMVEHLRRGEPPACGRRALAQSQVVSVRDPATVCAGCPLAQKYPGKAAMTVRLEHDGSARGLLSVSIPGELAEDSEEQDLLKEVAGDIILGLHRMTLEEENRRAREDLKRSHGKLQKIMDGTVHAMAKMLETRDPYTAGHQQRVARLACAIAEEMGLPQERVKGIHVAGTLHDVGKIYVPVEILSKPGRITDIEFNIIKTHSRCGYDILKEIEFPWPVAEIVIQHHERLDGSGYPQGLSGDSILTEARIIGVADVVEAMTSHRPYRPALGIEKALDEISRRKGTAYDSDAADACMRLFTEKGFEF